MSFEVKEQKQTKEVESFLKNLEERNPAETYFYQAVKEVAEHVLPFIKPGSDYEKYRVFERITEPDRIIIFRVCWEDDQGLTQMNRGYRVQFNNAIGPYKGGLRFHPSVTLDTFKFLGFEQVFKNSLTTLPMGAAKGGSDFDPKGKSDNEVMRFCQSFMTELIRHIGKDTDVPAGDIGVGSREIGYLFGQHKRLTNRFTGILTGKSLSFGGSLVRREATGYGCVFFVQEMLKTRKDSLEGKTCVVSGSGNVAQYTTQKALQLGGKVITLSDSSGFIHVPNGITHEQLDLIIDLKTNRRGRLSECTKLFDCQYFEGERPWRIPCDIAFPSATQNEVSLADAKTLVKNGCIAVGEGANMPSDADAVQFFLDSKILFGPAKAANAGGVAVSGLEMAQNSMRISWSWEDLETRLQDIMINIHKQCVQYGKEDDNVNYVKGANIAGFVKVADAMLDYGVL